MSWPSEPAPGVPQLIGSALLFDSAISSLNDFTPRLACADSAKLSPPIIAMWVKSPTGS